MKAISEFVNQVITGDCVKVMQEMPPASVDCVITDPPYLVRYKDRAGRTIKNDDSPEHVLSAFADLNRVLKPDTFLICFYGWQAVDKFFDAWRAAGFRPVGHLVFPKSYTTGGRYVRARHEQAYILAKGNPPQPSMPLDDVLKWYYSGNRVHPTEKAVRILVPLVEQFSKRGGLVLDPFAGSGSTLVAAALLGRRSLGIELDEKYCRLARKRLAGADAFAQRIATNPKRRAA